jgi:hypothetical protein
METRRSIGYAGASSTRRPTTWAATQREEPSKMFCPTCGTEAAADDRFCQRCGKPLPAPAAAPTGGATDAADASEMPAAAPPGATARSRFEPYPSAPPGATPFTDASGGHPPTWTAAGAAAGPPLAPFGAVLAGWWQRVGAALLDGLIVGIPLGIVLAVVNAGFGTPHVVVTAAAPPSPSGRSKVPHTGSCSSRLPCSPART